jgi:hypothetical protein
MNLRNLASFDGGTWRPVDHCHAPDCRHVEGETLAAPQSRSSHDLDFGQLVIPVANAIDGLGAEQDATPEFTGLEFRGDDNGDKYISIAPAAHHTTGAHR